MDKLKRMLPATMKLYKQIIPEKLEPKIMDIEKHPPKIPGFRISYLRQIIYWICTKKEKNGFSYLNMKYLRKYIPQAEQYIKYLLSIHLIERTKGYIPGEMSYGYRIASDYDSKYIVKIATDQKLIRRIQKTPRKFARGFGVQNTYIQNFTFDPVVKKFVERNYSGESYNNAMVCVNMVENNEKYSSIDEAGGRFYSNLTNMPSDLRKFVRVKKRFLRANVDIKNSQPYFIVLILTHPEEVARFAKSNDFAMILKTLKIPDKDDIKLFIDLVTNGQFYEYLIPFFEAKNLISPKWSSKEKRDLVKDATMKILFDRNRERLSRSKRIFKTLFPTVHELFSIVRGPGKGERFPILLQAIEAFVMLKKILPRINKEHPEIIAFTIHDSLLVTDNPEIVKRVMIEELTKFTGYSPIIKIDLLTRDDLLTQKAEIHEKQEKREEKTEEKTEKEESTIMILQPL
jgi:hypothetical protein